MADIQRTGVEEILRHFEELDDLRSAINPRHPLVGVVVIALMAVLAGADGPTAIAKWAAWKEDLLVEVLDLPNGVPRKYVFRRVLMALTPAAFQACFANWPRSLREAAAATSGLTQPVLAIEGKTARRSHDRRDGLGALHPVVAVSGCVREGKETAEVRYSISLEALSELARKPENQAILLNSERAS